MKRWPLITSFILFLVLCASVAYWSLRIFKPPQRAIAPLPLTSQPAPNLEAAAGLFGGRSSFAVTSNFQLTGVIVGSDPSESVAILAVNGKPAQAIRTNAEVAPGVTVKEIHKGYVFLSEGGVIKRVELPEKATAQMKVAIPANPAGAAALLQMKAGISVNPIGAVAPPAPLQMKTEISTKAAGTVPPPAALPDPSYGSSLLGKYYKDRNAKLRKTTPPDR
ncbi:MAG: type II secretion system protein N [Pseudomonadota bacterium]